MNRHERRANAKLKSETTAPRVLELLQAGVTHHQAGRFAEAEDNYRKVLAGQPDHADALHLLGLIAHQRGQLDAASALIQSALRQNARNAVYLTNLGVVLRDQKKVDEAIALCRQAIRIKSDFAPAHSTLGAALRDQGKFDDAVVAQRQAVRIDPRNADAHSGLGAALRDLGKFDEAIGAFRRAIGIRPETALFHFNLGATLQDGGQLDDAVAAHRQAIKIKPDYAEAYSNLGAALSDQGKGDEAVSACDRAIALKPDLAAAHCNLGAALRTQGNFDKAVAASQQAIRLNAGLAEAHCTLGAALRDQGKLDEAASALREAIRLKPGLAMAHGNLGATMSDQGRLDEAVAAYRQAIVLKPNDDVAYGNLGQALIQFGRAPEGRSALEQAVRLAPRTVRHRRYLGELDRFVIGDERLVALEELAQDAARLSVENQIELHFALGKAYEDVGDHAAAFHQLQAGNALKRRQIPYDETAMLGMFDRIRAVFTSGLIRKRNSGHPSPLPVFIVGMPRSGTTLVEQILASHRDAHGAGELKHFEDAMKNIQTKPGRPAIFPEMTPDLTDADFRDLGFRYAGEIARLAPSAQRIIDKMPLNFMVAGLIHLALPHAAIIHTVRDPIDTCVSCFSKLFADKMSHTYDLAELGRYYRRYQQLMTHWHRVLPAGRILDIRYEDVVADLEGQARRIVAHCGLDWDPQCLAFHRTERPVRTASATQVRQPIYANAVGRWRAYEPFLGPLVAELR